jgi:hypothetical protein
VRIGESISRDEASISKKELAVATTAAGASAMMADLLPHPFDICRPIEGTMTYGVSKQLAELFRENVNGTLGSEIARRAASPA